MSQEFDLTTFELKTSAGNVDAVWQVPVDPVAQLVFAHGAGAGYQHRTMQALADAFAEVGLASLRFNFPYMQQGKNRVDSIPTSIDTITAATELAEQTQRLPTFLTGHSFGGRMASHAVAEGRVTCEGLIYCSFPLHPAKKPSDKRAAHLPDIEQPMLFLSGTRDDLGDAKLLTKLTAKLKKNNPLTRLHWLDTANHSYVVLKRTRKSEVPVFNEMANVAREFVDTVCNS